VTDTGEPVAELKTRRLAHGKVNLTLAVTGRRADGFHELSSVFLRIGISDVLEASPRDGPGDRLTVEGDADCPIEDNLVLRALAAVRAHESLLPLDDRPLPWLDIRLTKRIPTGGGLGGGSSDAAVALDLLHPDLRSLAVERDPGMLARLGADVPFFAADMPAAVVSGVGERVEPLPGLRDEIGLLLIVPPRALATRQVFAAFDELPPAGDAAVSASERLASALRQGLTGDRLAAMAHELRDANDLWRAAIHVWPALKAVRDALEARLGRPVRMTGAGSTLFAVYPSQGAASSAARTLGESSDPVLSQCRVIVVDDTSMDSDWRIA
jgi:4-diphosphocytidyl-2-C-methyl-D-erythritol kinase